MLFEWFNSIKSHVVIATISLILALGIRDGVFESFKIPTDSMVPTLESGDFLITTKFDYALSLLGYRLPKFKKMPKRGDVIIYRSLDDSDIFLIRRVVALPGDLIEVSQGRLIFNSNLVPVNLDSSGCGQEMHPDVTYSICISEASMNSVRVLKVPDNSVFVVGDNRKSVEGARGWGTIPVGQIEGRARFVWLSVSQNRNSDRSWISRVRSKRVGLKP